MYPHNDLYHPRPRQPSTSSTLLTSSASASASGGSSYMPGRASTSTSWSDDAGTEVIKDDGAATATVASEGGWRDEAPLIDLDDEADGETGMTSFETRQEQDHDLAENAGLQQVGVGAGLGAEPTPGEKLRMLLRQMEAEVRSTGETPVERPVSALVESEYMSVAESSSSSSNRAKSHWREGRRIGALPKERDFSPPGSPPRRAITPDRSAFGAREMEVPIAHGSDEDDEDSPPTPPLRITNPYLYSSRRVSEGRETPTPPAQRLSSRAAVLHSSTSRSPPSLASAEQQPTPLETFIAQSSARPSGSFATATSPSRKGKERESPSPSTSPAQRKTHQLPARTPRKRSVEIAPDDSALFADEAMGLEECREEELDLEESMGDIPWEGEGSDTEASGSGGSGYEEHRDNTAKRSLQTSSGSNREATRRAISTPNRSAVQDESLPPLPEPDLSERVDDEPESFSSRRAALFRSSSKSRSSRLSSSIQESSPRSSMATTSQSQHSPHRSHNLSASSNPSVRHGSPKTSRNQPQSFPQQPIHVGMALTPIPTISSSTSTPSRVAAGDVANTTGLTPKPPGAWNSAKKPAAVRFSPLRQEVNFDRSGSGSVDDSSGNTSLHRIRLSPRKSPKQSSPSPKTKLQHHVDSPADGDTSFTARLKTLSRSLTRSSPSSARPPPPRPVPVPRPSTTLVDAREALSSAAEASAAARAKVEHSQQVWLEALALAGQGVGTGVEVVKTGVGWGRWLWWICMEILLVWGVFRVTLDYATTTTYNPFDPFSPPSNRALATRLPSAISAFVIPPANRRGSANFFDLLEKLELWSHVDARGDGRMGRGWVPT